MHWKILIRTTIEHFEFWSVELVNSTYTGKVKYGRIGTNGRFHTYNNGYEAGLKMREKLSDGYQIYSEAVSDPVPIESQVNAFLRSDNATRQVIREGTNDSPESTPSPVQRVSARLSQPRPIQTKYETTRTGNIKKYSGYTRPKIGGENVTVGHSNVRNLHPIDKFMEYFKSIPLEYRNNIREYGSQSERGTIRDTYGETFVSFNLRNKFVGVFSINTTTGNSSIFYIKSNETNKKEIVRYMLKIMSTMVSASEINIKKTPAVVEEEFKSILGVKVVRNVSPSVLNRNATETTGVNIKRVVNKWQ